MTTADSSAVSFVSYNEFLRELKEKIRNAQMKAAIAASSELIQLYWDLGKDIIERKDGEVKF